MERAAAGQAVWCLRSTQGSQHTARKWPLHIPDVCGLWVVTGKLILGQVQHSKVGQAPQGVCRNCACQHRNGASASANHEQEVLPQPEQACIVRMCRTLQQRALSSALSLASCSFTFKAIVAKVQLVDSCKWAEELERPAGAITRHLYRRDPPLRAGDAGPGGISEVARQSEATGIVAQPEKRAGVVCAAWCLRRELLGA